MAIKRMFSKMSLQTTWNQPLVTVMLNEGERNIFNYLIFICLKL